MLVLILEVPQKIFSVIFNKVIISKLIFKIGKMYICQLSIRSFFVGYPELLRRLSIRSTYIEHH